MNFQFFKVHEDGKYHITIDWEDSVYTSDFICGVQSSYKKFLWYDQNNDEPENQCLRCKIGKQVLLKYENDFFENLQKRLKKSQHKNKVFNDVLYQLYTLGNWGCDREKYSQLIELIFKYCRSFNVGNGMLSDEEELEMVERAFRNLENFSDVLYPKN